MSDNKYWKHPQYGMVYCGELATPHGNICWPGGLAKPKDPPPPQEGQPPGKPRYEGTLILDKKAPLVVTFCKQLEELAAGGVELFNKGRNATINLGSIFGKYGDGDAWDLEKYPYYKGCWVLTARNAEQPKIVNNKREPIEPGEIKGGMHGRFVVTPLITAHGVSYKLLIVQKFDGEYTPMAGGAREVLSLLDDLESEEVEHSGPAEAKVDSAVEKPKKGKQAAVNLLA